MRNPLPDDAVKDFDPQDPANASGLVVYLASDAASWLTGQVFRVHGNRVQRLRGWRAAGEYRSKSGRAVEPGELVAGLPEVYGTAPGQAARPRRTRSVTAPLLTRHPGRQVEDAERVVFVVDLPAGSPAGHRPGEDLPGHPRRRGHQG